MFSSLSICVVSFWKSSKKLVRCRGPFVIDHYRCVNLPPHWLRLCWCSHWEHQQARRSGVHRFNTDSHLFTDADNTRTTNTPRSKHWQAREMANNKVCEELITNMTTRENIVSGWGGVNFHFQHCVGFVENTQLHCVNSFINLILFLMVNYWLFETTSNFRIFKSFFKENYGLKQSVNPPRLPF